MTKSNRDTPAKTHEERIALLGIAEQFRSLSGFVNRLAESTNRNECVYGSIVKKALPEAFAALSELQAQFGDVNGGTQPRLDNEQMAETAKATGGVLVIKNDTAKDDAIDIARQLVANGKASERMKSELDTFDQHTRIIAQAGAEGLTVHSNIHTFRVCALRWIEGEIANLATSPEASF